MIAQPYAGHNALEAVAFVLQFAREFSEQEVEFLLSLEEKHKRDLPSFLKLTGLIVNVAESSSSKSAMMNQSQKLTGVLLQHFQENGKPDWALRVSGNHIIVNCWAYSRWNDIWPIAKNLLLSAAHVVQSDTNGVVFAALQMVDKFEYDRIPETYEVSDVFNIDSLYLTQQVCKSGPFWHVNQGWFEKDIIPGMVGGRRLNVLNLSSADFNGKLVSTIDYTGRIDREGYMAPVAELEQVADQQSALSLLDIVFSDLHESNAQILCKTLSKQKLDQIGLAR